MQVIRSQDGRSILNVAHIRELFILGGSVGNSTVSAIHGIADNCRIFTGTAEACADVHAALFISLKEGNSFDLKGYDPHAELGE